MSNAHGLSIAAIASVALTAPCLATTWVVDDNGGPGVDFVSIQAAIDAAVDGDVIEVRDGAYPGFTIDGKALVVISTAGAGESVRVAAPVLVSNVDATRRVELDGLKIGMSAAPPFLTAALRLQQNAGSIRLVDCTVLGNTSPDVGIYDLGRRDALDANTSAELSLLRCVVAGGDAYGLCYSQSEQACWPDGGAGLVLSASHAVALDSQFSGGDGDYDTLDGHHGGDATVLRSSSSFFAHRSTFAGGAASAGNCSFLCSGEPCAGGAMCDDGDDGSDVLVYESSSGTWKECTFEDVVVWGTWDEVAIAPYCLGTFEECPCGNNGAGTAGCEHSFGLGGARLEGVGNASVAADTVTLQVTGLNPSASPTALFFQGTTGSEGILFNDGLLCAGGTIRRMKGKLAQNGVVSFGFGQAGDPLVSVAGNVPPAGATRYYQVWYRNNSASFCTPQRFNMSNGVEIAWAP